MMNIGFQDAFTFIFRERRWWLKLGIIFSVNFSVIVLSLLTSYVGDSALKSAATLKSVTSTNYLATLIVGIFYIISSIVMTAFSMWYVYENVQSGIQSRQTKLIWEYSLITSIKRIAKYFITSFIYSFVALFVAAIFIGIPVLIGVMVVAALASGNVRESTPLIYVLTLCGCCLLAVVGIAFFALFYMITMPGYLRLIATNTFSEAFHLSSNWRIGKKYFGYLMLIAFTIFVIAFIIGLGSGLASIITISFRLINPTLGLITDILVQIPVTLVTTYLTYFVYSRLLGNFYKEVIKREDELKTLR